MKIMHKKRGILFSAFCILIGLITATSGVLYTFAQATDPVQYLQDIRLYQGKSDSDARDYFNRTGYTMLNSDLNAGTDTDQKVYLGFKTTPEKDKALTDIRMMAMDTGYQTYDYKSLSDYLVSQQDGTAQSMYSAASEFAANYEMGSPKAREALIGLNLFDLGDANKTKLGDFILSGGADKQFFVQMLVKSSAGAINDVISLLNIGIAPFQNNYDMDTQTAYTANWAERIPSSSIWQDLDSGMTNDEEESLNKQYNDLARKLFSAIQDFTTLYENAAARYNKDAVLQDDKFQSVDDAIDNMDNIEQEDLDPLYIASYNTLNQYPFNDQMMLGDWFLSIGRKTAESVDIMQLYPVVEAMTDNQVEIISMTGLVSAVSNLSENTQLTDYEEQIAHTKDVIRDYNGGTTISLWDVDGDDIENAAIALTSDAIRKQSAEQSLGKTSKLEKIDDKIQFVLKWVNIAIGAAFVLVGVVEVALKICLMCAASTSTFSAFCVSALSVISWISYGLLIVSALVLAFQLIYALVVWIIHLVEKKNKSLHHTQKPDFIFDAPETSAGTITVKYKSVLNNNGEVGDLNSAKQYQWCLLACTTDQRIGSPIRADDAGSLFKVVYGNSARQNGYDCVRFYGERNPANTNAFCEKDSKGGCYLHYRTEASITNESAEPSSQSETVGNGNYVKDLIVSVGKNEAEAKAKITAKAGSYYIVDANLSSGCSFATFIGYTITTDKKSAVKDIRVQPFAGKPEGVPTKLGGISYNFVENLGVCFEIGDEQTRPQADALYYTTDEAAGAPILADGLHVVRSFDDVQPGWEPVSLFCADYPYDFQTSYEATEQIHHPYYTGYSTKQSNNLGNHQGTYFYYEPETQYTQGTRYLSGFFFIGGRDYKTNSENKQINEKYDTLISYINSIPNAVIYGGDKDSANLASSLNHSVDSGAGTGGYWQNLVYTYTYNPKRAITDAVVFQGTLFSDALPYALSKIGTDGTQLNYLACSYIGQQSFDYGSTTRYISTGNGFRDSGAQNAKDVDYETIHKGHVAVSAFEQNVKYGFKVSDYISTGLYVMGPTAGRDPLKLSDVVITDKAFTGTAEGDSISFTLSGVKTLDNTDVTGIFHSIYELKNPHSTNALDLAFTNFFNYQGTETNPERSGNGRQTCSVYIYFRNPQQNQPKYISALSVGTYSRTQYTDKNPGADNDTLRGVDAIVDYQALVSATAGCVDEVVYTNFAIANQNDAWYNKCDIQGKSDRIAPENNVAAYIGVTRTDKADKAIKGVLLYQLDDSVAPNVVKLEGVEYICAGTQAPIEMNGKTYYLYYTTNSGVAPCAPITEIMVDNFPMTSGYATNLSGDKNADAPYGNPNQTNFIHLKYDKAERGIFNKLFIGIGSNKRAALCELLSQGCFEYIDMDLNTGIEGQSIYLGFRSKAVDWASINASATETARKTALDKALNEAVYDILLTRGEPYHAEGFVSDDNLYYYPVSDRDLTDGKGDLIYMYYCCPYYSKNYNDRNGASTRMPADVFSGYYRQIGMANGDRVPYNTSLAGAEGSDESLLRWEYVMFTGNRGPANPNAGTVSYNYEGRYAMDNRVSIFAQRSDGSVKPAGQITGGYVEETQQTGSLIYNRIGKG